VKEQQAGKGLADAVAICELWRLAVALQLLVVPSRVYEWSIHAIPNPNPVESHSIPRDDMYQNRMRECNRCVLPALQENAMAVCRA
jgi:hypothetical protein